jgi:hypothetical protein
LWQQQLGKYDMKKIICTFAGLMVFSSWASAGETLDADAVKKLVTGNTAHVLGPRGASKNYHSPDGKLIRLFDGAVYEGTWQVKDDGTHCVKGMPGGCGKISDNGDGTYTRNRDDGEILKWPAIVNGKDF